MKRVIYVYESMYHTFKLGIEFECNEKECRTIHRSVDELVEFLLREGYHVKEVIEK